ncbi:MBL fold metallo-hydrolase RNA specificity domain-containing protein [Nonomuraea sp. NPDC048916]|uniref:MBL fold metallo-hydrolase RNA specificity domain-containing protein n=1 Tax=Nonomuraea sp. NPDC048916 TaxID=3154232 RepID=UPI0033EC02BF
MPKVMSRRRHQSGGVSGYLARIAEGSRRRPGPIVTYIVHGEPDAAEALRARIRGGLGWHAVTPAPGGRVPLRAGAALVPRRRAAA